MRRIFIGMAAFGVAVGLAFQSAQAGERKSVRTGSERRDARSGIEQAARPGQAVAASTKIQARGELAFFQVTAFESRSAGVSEKTSRQREEQKPSGPTTPSERRTITLMRFNPNISVQPLIGGVNGAQLSVGF